MPQDSSRQFALGVSCLLLIAAGTFSAQALGAAVAPAGERYTCIERDGVSVLPNGRLLTPSGRHIPTAPHPFGLELSSDGNTLVTVNGGIGPFSITLVQDVRSSSPRTTQIPPGTRTDKSLLPSLFMGAAIDDHAGVVYVSGGNDGQLVALDLRTHRIVRRYYLDAGDCTDSFPTDLCLAADRRHLFALDLANFRLVAVDLVSSSIVSSVGVGRNPFAMVLSPDRRRAHVANMGTFQYSLVEERQGDDARGLSFPPFGYPSAEAKRGTVVDGRRVPGLGDPNVPEACSVWSVDVTDPSRLRVVEKTKTGVPVGRAVGGSSPAGLAITTDTLFVSNSVNDAVEAYDTTTLKRRWRTVLAPDPAHRHLRGVLPFGMDVSPDGKRLYVAESGINSVAVLDPVTGRQRGRIPVAWYPAKVRVSPDNRVLYVANAKGYGSGPNGGSGFTPGPEGASIGRLMKGTVSIIDIPDDARLQSMTKLVLANNGFTAPVAPSDETTTSIRHAVFIAKENRTFDEVFGSLRGVNGDAGLVRFGENCTVRPDEDVVTSPPLPMLTGVTVMPNHLALARRYAVSDNFYVEGDVSADGHHWLVNVYANHWVETITAAGYGGGASFRRSKAPGRLALFGSNAAVTPEDYLEDGGLWEHLARHGIQFRNYGEGFEFPGGSEEEDMKPTGIRLPVNIPMPSPLYANTCREYPTFNMQIPDQYRADQFIREFREKYVSGGEPLPSLIYIQLPGDHGAEARPAKGYPYLESYMADNDLALGRIVEELSRSRFWKDMAVFVTEDDAQSGVDHVDAHRSILMVIGPHVRPGYVSHRHSSTASIFRTIYAFLGLPSLNLCDSLASDLTDMFGDRVDASPYMALDVDRRVFDPEKVRDPRDPHYDKAGTTRSLPIDTVEESVRQQDAARRATR